MAKYIKLPEYIFESLYAYGNTIVSEKLYKKYGEEAILSTLKEYGFNCEIVPKVWKYPDTKVQDNIDYVIQIIH